MPLGRNEVVHVRPASAGTGHTVTLLAVVGAITAATIARYGLGEWDRAGAVAWLVVALVFVVIGAAIWRRETRLSKIAVEPKGLRLGDRVVPWSALTVTGSGRLEVRAGRERVLLFPPHIANPSP